MFRKKFAQNKSLYYLLILAFIFSFLTVYENKNEFLELESIFIINQYLEIKDKLSEKLSPIDFDNYLFDGGRNE